MTDALEDEGVFYTSTRRRFPRSKLQEVLRDRSYISEVRWHDEWYPGQHSPLVDRGTLERVQVLLGDASYANYESVYGSGPNECVHCAGYAPIGRGRRGMGTRPREEWIVETGMREPTVASEALDCARRMSQNTGQTMSLAWGRV